MEILAFATWLLRVFELLPMVGEKFTRLPRNFAWFSAVACLYVPAVVFTVENISNIPDATESLYYLSGSMLLMIKYLTYFFQQRTVMLVKTGLQKIVDENAANKHPLAKEYEKTEKFITTLCKWYTFFIIETVYAILLTPLIVVFFTWITTDNYINDHLLPMKITLPFNTTTFPGYQIAYLVSIINLTILGTLQVATDSFFLGSCMHISQCFKVMQSDLRQIDGADVRQQAAVTKKLLDLHELHIRSIGVFKDICTFATTVIFSEFLSAILMLIGSLLQLSAPNTNNIAITLKFIFIALSALATLVIYCIFGDDVTSQGLELANASYDSKWYNLTKSQKIYIKFMIMRAHRPLIFHGYHFFRCNLFTYTEVVKTSVSMAMVFTRLQAQ